MLRSLFAALFCFALISFGTAATHKDADASRPVLTWSRAAIPLPFPAAQDPSLVNTRVPSPDGKHEITCGAGETFREDSAQAACFLMAHGKRVSEITLATGPEALWAPDSRAVAITSSNGGALGTYRVGIYRPGRNGSTDISSAVRRDLARRFPPCVGRLAGCTTEERRNLKRDVSWVNVAAIRWDKGSSRLLMLAWVPSTAYFGDNMGKYNGYVVDASSGHILRRYSKKEFEHRFRKYCGDWGL